MRRLIALASGLVVLLSAPTSYALGFGEIQLNSALNQPLKAEIPLLAVKPGERDQVSVDVASPDTFKRFGIERPGILDQIDIHVEPGADQSRLRVLVSSRVPIKEPFLTFLVEANWPAGRAIREYTVLLDPPVNLAASSAQTQPPPAQPAPVQKAVTRPRPPKPRPTPPPTPSTPPHAAPAATPQRPAPVPAARPQPKPPTPSRSSAYGSYGPVAPRETLWSIAKEMRPASDIGMNQMMLAIYQANPDDFDGNINLIRKGAVLIIPTAQEIRAINKQVAKSEIADQGKSYRSGVSNRFNLAKNEKTSKPKAQSAAKPGKAKLRLEPATDEKPTAASETAKSKSKDDSESAATKQAAVAPGDTLDALGPGASDVEESAAAVADTEDAGKPASNATVAANDSASSNKATVAATDETNPEESSDGAKPANVAATANKEDTAPKTPSGSAANAEDATQLAGSGSNEAASQNESDKPAEAAAPTVPAVSGSANKTKTATAKNQPANPDALPASPAPALVATAGAMVTPRRILLLLAGLLLVVALWMVWDRRKYKPVPADFNWDTPLDDADQGAGKATRGSGQAVSAATEQDAQDVDELLADADSFIENELYDEAQDSLQLGLTMHPGHPALQRKILEVHYAAGEREQFMRKLDNYFPNAAPGDPNWLAVAAMARELAPDDARFETADAEQQLKAQATQDEAHTAASDALDLPTEAGQNTGLNSVTGKASGDEIEAQDQPGEDKASPFMTEDPVALDDSTFQGATADTDLTDFQATQDTDSTQADQSDATLIDDPFAPPEDSRDKDEAPVTEEPTPASTSTSADDDAGLDFDLSDFDGLGSDASDSVPGIAANTPPKADEEPPDTLEFDLSEFELEPGKDESTGHKVSGASQDEPAVSSDTASTEPASEDGLGLADELDWPQSPSPTSEDSAADPDGLDNLIAQEEGPDLNFPNPASGGFSTGADTGDNSLPDLDTLDNDPAAKDAADEQPNTDFESDVAALDQIQLGSGSDSGAMEDLQLDDIQYDQDNAAADSSDGLIADNPDEGDDLPGEDDEILTKLDLARAYIDMGESDMAASLLEDVQAQGTPEQQREAQSLLSRTG